MTKIDVSASNAEAPKVAAAGDTSKPAQNPTPQQQTQEPAKPADKPSEQQK